MEELIAMNKKELKRCEILEKIKNKRISQVHAAKELSISERQVQRLWAAYKQTGPEGIISKKRGQPSTRKLSEVIKTKAIGLIKLYYYDYGPTLAAEKLKERDGINLGVETVRQLMIEHEVWVTRAQKIKRAYQPRHRRASEGDLVQIDGSDHEWFEDLAPRCTLLVYIDDATSKLKHLRFVYAESTFTYFESTKAYLNKYGKPVAFYSDKLGVFRVNQKSIKNKGDGITQFGRAMDSLNIEIICANSPQAKGRVERANGTLQDRLVKEMRLRNICSMEEGNAFLSEFIEDYNKRFGKPSLSGQDAHRPLKPGEIEQLDNIFCWQESRTLTRNLTLQYDKVLYIIEDTLENRKLKNTKVLVHDYQDGEIKIFHNDRELNHREFDKIATSHQGKVVPFKRLTRTIALVKEQQALRDEQRSQSCPKREKK